MKALAHRVLAVPLLSFLIATTAAANTQLTLTRGDANQLTTEYTGIVDLVIDPAIENAKVTVTVDGQKVASGILPPYRLTVDLGPTPM